jgi:hypothetical protein
MWVRRAFSSLARRIPDDERSEEELVLRVSCCTNCEFSAKRTVGRWPGADMEKHNAKNNSTFIILEILSVREA